MLQRLREVPWDALRSEVALPAIARVLQGATAEREVDRALRANRGLSADQRTAIVEAIFGVALWRRRLAWHAGLDASLFSWIPLPRPASITSSGSDIAAILLACLLRDLAGVPEERACSSTGVAQPPPLRPQPSRLADRWSLPDWLEAHLEHELGTEAEPFCAAIAVPGPVCLRANLLLCTRDQLAARLRDEGIATRPGQRSPDALIVETRNANLFGAEAWRAGLFEPQDEGSQLLGQLVEAQPGDTVLDLCAGAGGKSLLLAAQGANVLAHDIDRGRLSRLKTRALRAQAGNIAIAPAPAPADSVLVDAPCSELGILRRGPDARWLIQLESLVAHLPVQRELLEIAARCARRRVVYATCTINRLENEDAAARFEAAHPEFRRARDFLQLLPHKDGTDGFFAAVWDRR
jgi:16S rRNA (cytosine967-C5)-methyltransferase